MFGRVFFVFHCGRISSRLVLTKREAVIVVPVIRVTLPVSRQSDGIHGFLKAAVTNQLSVQTVLDSLEHELHKLSVEQRADAAFNLARVNLDSRRERSLLADALLTEQAEKEEQRRDISQSA